MWAQLRQSACSITPHSSLLTPHSSLLTPHSSLLTPHYLKNPGVHPDQSNSAQHTIPASFQGPRGPFAARSTMTTRVWAFTRKQPGTLLPALNTPHPNHPALPREGDINQNIGHYCCSRPETTADTLPDFLHNSPIPCPDLSLLNSPLSLSLSLSFSLSHHHITSLRNHEIFPPLFTSLHHPSSNLSPFSPSHPGGIQHDVT